MFFMITDPKTIPSGRVARVAYGAGVGFLAAAAVAPATTEFWTKVGVLAALIVVCAGRPLLERVLPAPGDPSDDLGTWLRAAARGRGPAVVAAGVLVPLLAVALLAVAALPSRSAAAAGEAAVAAAGSTVTPNAALPVAPPAVPRVTLGSSVGSFKAPITQAAAQRIATDLADDLATEAEAYRTGDPALAASADTGAWLATVTAEIGNHPPAAAPTRYTLTRLTLELVADRVRPQNPPTVEIEAAGTAASGSSSPAPFATTFSLASSGGAYLISGESPPLGH